MELYAFFHRLCIVIYYGKFLNKIPLFRFFSIIALHKSYNRKKRMEGFL